MASTLNLNNVPAELKAAIEERYADCPSLKELADSFGITVSRLHNIAHAMHVPRSFAARSRDSSVRSTVNLHRFPDYLI